MSLHVQDNLALHKYTHLYEVSIQQQMGVTDWTVYLWPYDFVVRIVTTAVDCISQ